MTIYATRAANLQSSSSANAASVLVVVLDFDDEAGSGEIMGTVAAFELVDVVLAAGVTAGAAAGVAAGATLAPLANVVVTPGEALPLTIVPMPFDVPKVTFVGADRLMKNVSLAALFVSPVIWIVIGCEVTPGANVSVPDWAT